MILEGKIYKSYRELCAELGEKPTTGNAKKSQLDRWKTQFDYHTEGYKIVIDKIYDSPIKQSAIWGGNNRGNMKIYLPYIYSCIYREFPENQSMTKILCDTLKLINIDTLKELHSDSKEIFGMTGAELKEFRKWVRRAGKFISDSVIKSLDRLQKDGLIVYNTAYAFLSKPERTRYVGYVAGFDEYIKQIEVENCNRINKEREISKRIRGKQLEFIILRDKSLANTYKKRVLKQIMGNSELKKALQASMDEIYYKVDIDSEDYPISKYWKVWSVTEIEPPNEIDIREARQKFINLIVDKTAKGREIPIKWQNLVFG